jgi:hypothetical protein
MVPSFVREIAPFKHLQAQMVCFLLHQFDNRLGTHKHLSTRGELRYLHLCVASQVPLATQLGFHLASPKFLRSVGRALLRPGPVSRRLILRRRWYQKDRNGYPTTGDFIWLDLVWESDEWEPPIFVIVVFVVLFTASPGIGRMGESGHAPGYKGRF